MELLERFKQVLKDSKLSELEMSFNFKCSPEEFQSILSNAKPYTQDQELTMLRFIFKESKQAEGYWKNEFRKLQTAHDGIITRSGEGYQPTDKLDTSNPPRQLIELTEEIMIQCGWKYYNGKTEGDMTNDTPCKMDVDWVDGKLQIKSHYEPGERYRPLPIKYLHQLQEFWKLFTGTELVFNKFPVHHETGNSFVKE